MTQCVPSWDLDDNPTPITLNFCPPSNSSNSFTPSLDYEVAELTWENGQLAMYGLTTPRVAGNKPAAAAWEKPRAADTLECIVNQATTHPHSKTGGGGGNNGNKLVPWLDSRPRMAKPAASAALDALVPCNNTQETSTHVLAGSVPGTGTCMAGSCSGAATSVGGGCLGRGRCASFASASETSATCGGRDSQQVTLDSSEREFGGGGITSTSLWSPENTSSGKDYTKTSGEDHDSVCRGRSQRQTGEKGNKKGIGKSSISAKSRAAVHNQSERRRRDKINQRMKTLQKLVPNSSKTDKASMLDEVIEYLKQLQAQINMMSRMNMPSMMMPMSMPMQHQFQMPMMAPGGSMGIGMGMGMGMGMGVMDINAISRAAGMPPMPTPAAFMPPWDIQAGADRMHFPPLTPDLLSTFFACQSQPTTMDAYSRMAALYQQMQIQQSSAASASKNS